MLLTSLTGKVQNVSLATKGKSRFYTTSVATKSLLGDTHSDAARRFIQQGRGVYTVLPGNIHIYIFCPELEHVMIAGGDFTHLHLFHILFLLCILNRRGGCL